MAGWKSPTGSDAARGLTSGCAATCAPFSETTPVNVSLTQSPSVLSLATRESAAITQKIGDRRVAITIRDTGKGIAEDDLPRIFDPYFTTRRAGTGLGLAIAKNIVEGLGGSISVATRPGAGTDFRIDIGDAPARAEG